jgi:hypothetical protein
MPDALAQIPPHLSFCSLSFRIEPYRSLPMGLAEHIELTEKICRAYRVYDELEERLDKL